jgi:23S rRNA pseudouridine2605 synthase
MVNGATVSTAGVQVDPDNDEVRLDGVIVTINTEKRWYLLNKPMGVLSTRSDTHRRATVYDLLGPETAGVFSVGRLDADTTGVLLFTDDGDMAHRLTHPSTEVEKVYRAEVSGVAGDDDVRAAAEGIPFDNGVASPAVLTVISAGAEGSVVELVIHEGKKRQVRRMLFAREHPVRHLERVSFAGISDRGLGLGQYRTLTKDEIALLTVAAGMDTTGETP